WPPCRVRSIGAGDDAIVSLTFHCGAKRHRAFPGRPAWRQLLLSPPLLFLLHRDCQTATPVRCRTDSQPLLRAIVGSIWRTPGWCGEPRRSPRLRGERIGETLSLSSFDESS